MQPCRLMQNAAMHSTAKVFFNMVCSCLYVMPLWPLSASCGLAAAYVIALRAILVVGGSPFGRLLLALGRTLGGGLILVLGRRLGLGLCLGGRSCFGSRLGLGGRLRPGHRRRRA